MSDRNNVYNKNKSNIKNSSIVLNEAANQIYYNIVKNLNQKSCNTKQANNFKKDINDNIDKSIKHVKVNSSYNLKQIYTINENINLNNKINSKVVLTEKLLNNIDKSNNLKQKTPFNMNKGKCNIKNNKIKSIEKSNSNIINKTPVIYKPKNKNISNNLKDNKSSFFLIENINKNQLDTVNIINNYKKEQVIKSKSPIIKKANTSFKANNYKLYNKTTIANNNNNNNNFNEIKVNNYKQTNKHKALLNLFADENINLKKNINEKKEKCINKCLNNNLKTEIRFSFSNTNINDSNKNNTNIINANSFITNIQNKHDNKNSFNKSVSINKIDSNFFNNKINIKNQKKKINNDTKIINLNNKNQTNYLKSNFSKFNNSKTVKDYFTNNKNSNKLFKSEECNINLENICKGKIKCNSNLFKTKKHKKSLSNQFGIKNASESNKKININSSIIKNSFININSINSNDNSNKNNYIKKKYSSSYVCNKQKDYFNNNNNNEENIININQNQNVHKETKDANKLNSSNNLNNNIYNYNYKSYKPLTDEDKNKLLQEMNKDTQLNLNVYGDIFINIRNEMINLEKSSKNLKNIEIDDNLAKVNYYSSNNNMLNNTNLNKFNKNILTEIKESKEPEEIDNIILNNKNKTNINNNNIDEETLESSKINICYNKNNLKEYSKKDNEFNLYNEFNKKYKNININNKNDNKVIYDNEFIKKYNINTISLDLQNIKENNNNSNNNKNIQDIFNINGNSIKKSNKTLVIQYEKLITEKAKKLVEDLKPYNSYKSPFPCFSNIGKKYYKNKLDNKKKAYSLSISNILNSNYTEDIKLSSINIINIKDDVNNFITNNLKQDTPVVYNVNKNSTLNNFKKNKSLSKKQTYMNKISERNR